MRTAGRKGRFWLLAVSFGVGFLSGGALLEDVGSPAFDWLTGLFEAHNEAVRPVREPASQPLTRQARPAGQTAQRPIVAVDDGSGPSGTTKVRIRRGETLLDVLLREGVPSEEAQEVVRCLRPIYDPRRLQVGQTLALELGGDAETRLVSLSLEVDPTSSVRLARDEAGSFSVRSIDHPLERDTVRVAAQIADSLYSAAQRAGLPPEAFGELTQLLSWDVDFQRDIHPGDRFELLVDRLVNNKGQLVRTEGLSYVALELRDRRIEAYRFTTRDGRTSYYDALGRPLRKSLLRTPVDGARLSSTFGPRRHPILGFTRMHKGVDFAAPSGTPIYAAGDGEIDFVGRNRGYGKYVRIRHNGEFSTAYGHMSRFAPGIARGSKVSQGQVIGYVGATGLATGPHLHYEILDNGEQVNPLGLKPTFADQLDGIELRRFRQQKEQIDALREGLGGGQLVAQAGQ